jgi:hydroxyacylglutathione hydrolase
MLSIKTMVLGPAETNAYLIADTEANEAVVVDPAWDGHLIQAEARKYGWNIHQVWVTHAHFDHIGGISGILAPPTPGSDRLIIPIGLHPSDFPLWQMQGGAPLFGFQIDLGFEPTLWLAHDQALSVGKYSFQVRHAPGHTPGHVIFYCPTEKITFTGDVIFKNSIGRTDLPGGSYNQLIDSIHQQVLVLPDDVRLLSGHGPDTKVGAEKRNNPFLV